METKETYNAWVVHEARCLFSVPRPVCLLFELMVAAVCKAADTVHALGFVLVRRWQLVALRVPDDLRRVCLPVLPVGLAPLLLIVLAAPVRPVLGELVGGGPRHRVLLLRVHLEQLLWLDGRLLSEDQEVVKAPLAVVRELGLLPAEGWHCVGLVIHDERMGQLSAVGAELAHAHVVLRRRASAHRRRVQ